MIRLTILLTIACLFGSGSQAQYGYWQQHADYQMEIDLNVETHQFIGKQRLVYTNNSPDTLHRVFYHLYFNAFQPGSMMDHRARNIQDADPRVGDRISKLSPSECGYHKIDKLTQDGVNLNYEVEGTVLEVDLAIPILPNGQAVFHMEFNSQVPIQIRRSGRDNAEGVAYSMTQWYPKMVEYDFEGWHADPYVGREFHGVWADFDVKITIDKDQVIGGTGYLQNPHEIGHGYEPDGYTVKEPLSGKLTWHFKAPRVHDFAWAADPEFLHVKKQVPNGPMMHFLYQPDTTGNWEKLPDDAIEAFEIQSGLFGKYPYEQFSVIQGGDGGMEYPMATLIANDGDYAGLLSVTVHEALHNWYYGVLATNEGKYPWMDEGFTTFAQYVVLDSIYRNRAVNPHQRQLEGLAGLYIAGLQEPATTLADHYHTNYAYGITSYHKGCLFVRQLQYIVGEENFWIGMKRFFNEWGFKHPTPNDFIRVMEKQSGLELSWYLDLFIGTTQYTDYSIEEVSKEKKGRTSIHLKRNGQMPMPVDVQVVDQEGNKTLYHIPMTIMRGEKPDEGHGHRVVLSDWQWTDPNYSFEVDMRRKKIASIVIDPTQRIVDLNTLNGVYPFPKERKKK